MIEFLAEIRALENEDEARFVELLFERYSRNVKAFALGILKNEEDAEDALEQTFLKVIRYRERLTGLDEDIVKGFLINYTRTTCIDLLRKRKHMSVLSLNDERIPGGDDPSGKVICADETAYLAELLRGLDSPAREIVVMKYYHGAKSADIAELLGLTPANVRMILHRTLKKLKKRMEVGGYGTENHGL